jgi:hypothetical protein
LCDLLWCGCQKIGEGETPTRISFGTEALASGVGSDVLGRDFLDVVPLHAPYYAVKVTSAFFRTQGGLVIDNTARVHRG